MCISREGVLSIIHQKKKGLTILKIVRKAIVVKEYFDNVVKSDNTIINKEI